jgi:chorismate synthase
MSSKIVVCTNVSSAEEFIKIAKNQMVKSQASFIELRGDYLLPSERTQKNLAKIKNNVSLPIIFTCRSKTQGSSNNLNDEERMHFYNAAITLDFPIIDIDYKDFKLFKSLLKVEKSACQIILSYHSFNGTNWSDILEHYYKMKDLCPDFIKIATYTSTKSETTTLKSLQKELISSESRLSLFGMGFNSLITRAAGYWKGNAFTYVGFDETTTTAPNQPSLSQFLEVSGIYSTILKSEADVFGRSLQFSLFGASHAPYIGIYLQNPPATEEIDLESVQQLLNVRKPGTSSLVSARKEADQAKYLTGFRFHSDSTVQRVSLTGEDIIILIPNEDVKSQDYTRFRTIPRPSHVDLPLMLRYGTDSDIAGGGRLSGRMTAPLVAAGAIALQILTQHAISIAAFVSQVGAITDPSAESYTCTQIQHSITSNPIRTVNPDLASQMKDLILETKKQEDSVGGIVSVRVENFPAGIGDPWFHSLECDIAAAMMAIPATRGIEFGSGFKTAKMKGSDHNDPYVFQNDQIITKSNHAGGIIGGISIGTPIQFNVAIKPTASIKREQQTLNLNSKKVDSLTITGRHDPCIAPRISVVIQAMTALVLLDALKCSHKIE